MSHKKEGVANVLALKSPESVTLFIANEPWGPIVSGKTMDEAKAKMKEGFLLSMIANTLWENDPESGLTAHRDPKVKQTLKHLDEALCALA